MKTLHFLSIMFFSYSFSALGAPCSGALGANHINKDGSSGGFVAKTASVSTTVILDNSSEVCDQATVSGNSRIRSNSKISGKSSLEGNVTVSSSKIYGSAKIFGSASISGSKVCQGSIVNFSVTNSDYYCQTDDEEPKDPGELGNKTLIGIDSNLNGMRDDVEIWINTNTSNTPNKNMQDIRLSLKQIAKNVQAHTINKDNEIEAKRYAVEVMKAFTCLSDVTTSEEYKNFESNLQVKLYNTEDRFYSWARMQGNLNGQTYSVQKNKKKGSTCEFTVR